MLISFSSLCEKYKFVPNGILHIGAHEMEEALDYAKYHIENIIWVEGNPDLVKSGLSKISNTKGQTLLHGLVYSEDDIDIQFKITNNSQSSSILDFGKHKEYHPQVSFVKSIQLKTTRIDSLLKKNNFNPGQFDFVNLDIQGVELQALKGFGEYLGPVKYIYTEVNTGEVYINNDSMDQMDKFLENLGFSRVETRITEFEWGDVFYIKQNKW
jgi:FkbM family methyltransferase